MSAWASLPSAMYPSGMRTAHVRPALEAYAAALADVLPVDAHTTAFAPSSTALEMATVMPRSLNDPVGLAPSTFSQTCAPTRSDRRGAGNSGVPPSNSVTTGVASVTGKWARYSSITPFHVEPRRPPIRVARCLLLADDPQQRADAVHGVELSQTVERGLHVPLLG